MPIPVLYKLERNEKICQIHVALWEVWFKTVIHLRLTLLKEIALNPILQSGHV